MVLRYNWLDIDRRKGSHCRSTNGTSTACWTGTDERKSAVELLQETKGRYVKSGSVLENTQKPDRPDHLKITPPAHPFASLSQTQCVSPRVVPPIVDVEQIKKSPTVDIVPLTSDALAKFTAVNASPLPVQNSRKGSFVPPRLRTRAKTQPVKGGISDSKANDLRRSYSHGPSDLQSKLRRLLNTESKECLFIPAISGEKAKNNHVKPTHKSLPDLITSSCRNPECSRRRPSCPKHILFNNHPPPIPPRPIKKKDVPPSPPPRYNTQKIPPPRPPPPKKIYNPSNSIIINENNLFSVFTGDIGECLNNKSPKSEFSGYNKLYQVEINKRPIVRSVSDVTSERSTGMSLPDNLFEHGDWNVNKAKIENFFESLGCTANGYNGSPPKSPPTYFEDEPSSRSNSLRRNSSGSFEELASSAHASKSEPSIIEKNARVIKWLFKVQKAKFDGGSPQKS